MIKKIGQGLSVKQRNRSTEGVLWRTSTRKEMAYRGHCSETIDGHVLKPRTASQGVVIKKIGQRLSVKQRTGVQTVYLGEEVHGKEWRTEEVRTTLGVR